MKSEQVACPLPESLQAKEALESVEDIAKRILSDGGIFREIEYLDSTDDLSESDGTVLVKKDVRAGAQLRTENSVVVLGSVMGISGKNCRISTEGKVAILGYAEQCAIRAEEVSIGQDSCGSRFEVENQLDIRGDVIDSAVIMRSSKREIQEIEVLEKDIRQVTSARSAMEHQLRMEQRKLEKLFKATRIVFDLNVGQIIRHSERGLVINLDPFYSVVAEKSDLEIDRALREFFAKAVMGLLTRLNRSYILEGKSKRHTFMKVLRKLQDLLYLTRSLDKQTIKCRIADEKLARVAGTHRRRDRVVRVSGSVNPEFDLKIDDPDLVQQAKSDAETEDRKVACSVRMEVAGFGPEVLFLDSTGEEMRSIVDSELQNLTFIIRDGGIVVEGFGMTELRPIEYCR